MKVRLRFRCTEKKEQGNYPGEKNGSATLTPVFPTPGDPDEAEIKSFYRYTPSGRCEFSTINQAALDELVIGEDYYLTIERVPKAAAESEVVAAT